MTEAKDYAVLVAPREGVNDDVVRVLKWLVGDGVQVREKQAVVTLETAKSTFDVDAPSDGYFFPLVTEGAEVPVGSALAVVAPTRQRPQLTAGRLDASVAETLVQDQVVTKKARGLIEGHGLSLQDYAGLAVVRGEDIEKILERKKIGSTRPAARLFRNEELDPSADWDAVLQEPEFVQLKKLLIGLRKRLRAKYNRHVPMGSLLYDRWDLAKDYGFGEGTSVYDECLILGDVKLGRQCWVGPYTILDASQAPLMIGDYVDIGAGSHLYTHNSIERALTGHKAPLFTKATTIGNCCFIAPQSIIAPGTVLGDHCFVAAGSYVEGAFASFSYIAGSPAKQVGVVELSGNRARIRRFAGHEQGS